MDQQQAVGQLLQYYNELKVDRSPWEATWREIVRYTLPISQFDNVGKPGRTLTEFLYDGSAINASNRLASELLGMTLNANQRTFEFEPIDLRYQHDDPTKKLLQHVGDCVQDLLYAPEYNFYPKAHEMLVEYVNFGQGTMLTERVENRPRYTTCPLVQTYVDLDHDRKVNTVIRVWMMSLRQLRGMFPPSKFPWPEQLLNKLAQPNTAGEQIEVIQAVVPTEDHSISGFMTYKADPKTGKDYPYTSVFCIQQPNHCFEIKGLKRFPYAVPRYMMMSNEKYGRGPGSFALPDIRMTNAMERTNLTSAQRQGAPPMIVPRRGFLKPLDASPNAINYTDSLEEVKIQSFGIDGNPQVAFEYVQKHQGQINQTYMIDQISGPDKKAEMREAEVLYDQESRLRAMAPQLGRLTSEWLSEVINTLVVLFEDEILASYDGDMPESMKGGLSFKIRYMNPLQRAQNMLELANVSRVFQQFVLPLAQVDKEILKQLNMSDYMSYVFQNANLPQRFVKPPEEAAQEQQAAEEKAQMQGGLASAVDASAAAKNFAQAQQAMAQTQAQGNGQPLI